MKESKNNIPLSPPFPDPRILFIWLQKALKKVFPAWKKKLAGKGEKAFLIHPLSWA